MQFKNKDSDELILRGFKIIYHAKSKHKNVEMATLILSKTNLKKKTIKVMGGKAEGRIPSWGSTMKSNNDICINQEHIEFINVFVLYNNKLKIYKTKAGDN